MSFQTDASGAAIGAGMVGAATVAAAAQIAAAQMAADAQRDANAKNLQANQEANALRQRLFHETRGSEGSAILPEYQKAFEAQLSADTLGNYAALSGYLGTPENQVSTYEALTNRMKPSFDAGTSVMDSIYNGKMTQDRLAEAAPVATARENVATANRAAVMQSLRKRLNAVQAQQSAAGYSSSGSTASKALFRETLGPMQQANTLQAGASLDNATERQRIQQEQRQLALNSMDLPLARAQQAVQMATMPVTAVSQTAQQLQQPLRFFYMGPGTAPQVSNPPLVSAVPGMGQIVAQGIGNMAQSAGNYMANQSLVNQLRSINSQNQQIQPLYQSQGYQGNPALNPYGYGAGATTGYDSYEGDINSDNYWG